MANSQYVNVNIGYPIMYIMSLRVSQFLKANLPKFEIQNWKHRIKAVSRGGGFSPPP